MWLSGIGDATPSIQYEFDKAYKLHELWVWNSNQLIEAFVGLGAKDVVIEYSADGIAWMTLEGVAPFAQATGNASYTANTIVDFGGVLAQAVRIIINSGYGMLPQFGISEVRFYAIPTFPREHQPAQGETTDGANVVLAWRAGREAASHQVNLGTDAENLSLVSTTSDSTYTATGLNYGTSYYWQVTEVNENETPSSYAGVVQSFTTPDFGTVDDFEQYDDNCERIFFTWEDGIGHNGGEGVEGCDVAPSNGNGGGAIVGNDMAPFAEKTIVSLGSTQSMPLNYDNAFGQSEITRSIAGQDWTASDVQTLSVSFSGSAGNTGQLYVKINNTKVVYGQNLADLAPDLWQVWDIDLSAISGLQNVTQFAIGIDGANAAGMLYIDEIRLYPPRSVGPEGSNLAGHWSFDEGSGDVAADSSGNGYDGTIVNATWETGQQGSALGFNGSASVDVPVQAWASISTEVTVAFWQYAETTPPNNFTFGAFNGASRVGSAHVPWGGQVYWDTSGPGGFDRINQAIQDSEYLGDWHHWAFVKNAESGLKAIYLDGALWHSGTGWTHLIQGADVTGFTIGTQPSGASSFVGLLDDFRLYNQALSEAEISDLAGQ